MDSVLWWLDTRRARANVGGFADLAKEERVNGLDDGVWAIKE